MKKLYLLHGSLGAGKTTLLNKMLSNSFFKKSVVIENEFANFSIDEYLIHKNENNVRADIIAGGCICCTSGQEFLDTLNRLASLPNIDKIIVESTGVANSIEIIKQIILSEGFENKFEFGANIMLVDALEDDVKELAVNKIKEITLSDLVLLTKTDIVDLNKVNKIISTLKKVSLNIQKSVNGDFNSAPFFIDDFISLVVEKIRNNIDEYLSSRASDVTNDSYFVMKMEAKIDDFKIKKFVKELMKDKSINVKRIKGFYTNSNSESIIINGTKNNIEYLLSEDDVNKNVIVMIGSNLDAIKIENIKYKVLNDHE